MLVAIIAGIHGNLPALEGGIDLLCYHGSPRSFHDVISATTPDADLEPMLAGIRRRSMLRRSQDSILLNPGSVGMVYDVLDGDTVRVPPRAEHGLIRSNSVRLSIDLRRIPYDRDATVRAMFERGMPHAEW